MSPTIVACSDSALLSPPSLNQPHPTPSVLCPALELGHDPHDDPSFRCSIWGRENGQSSQTLWGGTCHSTSRGSITNITANLQSVLISACEKVCACMGTPYLLLRCVWQWISHVCYMVASVQLCRHGARAESVQVQVCRGHGPLAFTSSLIEVSAARQTALFYRVKRKV